jgi:two-component system OmpR family response regulator
MDHPANVLVVDDDPDLIDVVQAILCSAGYEVRAATSAKEAFDAVAERIPTLVLLDVMMPDMDGWQCARELRSRYGGSMRIVVVTATAHARARADEVGGVDDVLSKPFEIDDLLGVVARSCESRPALLQDGKP